MDDATRGEVAAWLTKAHRDLDSASRLFAGVPPYRDTAAYHCQQAAEKAIKAFLTMAGTTYPKTHDLVVLVELAADIAPEFARLSDAAIVLTPYATLYRYPDAIMEPDDADILEALSLARMVLEAIERSVPTEN